MTETRSDEINELVAALAKAAGTIENAKINKVNPHFKSRYADLASCFDAVRKPLGANGLVITQTTEMRDNSFVLVTTLAHASGQWLKSEYPLPTAGRPQELGSALTYARRYSLSAITGIAADEYDDDKGDGDDDAEGAEAQKQTVSAIRVEYISEGQQATLRKMIEEKGRSVDKFCLMFSAGTLANIPANKYSDALAAIANAPAVNK